MTQPIHARATGAGTLEGQGQGAARALASAAAAHRHEGVASGAPAILGVAGAITALEMLASGIAPARPRTSGVIVLDALGQATVRAGVRAGILADAEAQTIGIARATAAADGHARDGNPPPRRDSKSYRFR